MDNIDNTPNNDDEKLFNFNEIENQEEQNEITIDEFFDKITIKKKEKQKITIIKPENSSGTGEDVPDSIANKFNWGAFLFNWIWGLKYKKWELLSIPVLLFIPYGFIAAFVIALWAGIKGNQWAWEEVIYKNEADFHKCQQSWVKWWIALAASFILTAGIVFLTLLPKEKQKVEVSIPTYSFLSTLELDIPQEVYDDTKEHDEYFNFLTSNKNIVYWVKQEKENTLANKEFLEQEFKNNQDQLDDKFVLISDLIDNSEDKAKLPEVTCEKENGMCIQKWLYTNCNSGFCIINPQKKKYVKVRDKKNVIKQVLKLKKSWNK